MSVDIDLNYIASTDLATMLAERPALKQAITDVAEGLGFSVRPSKPQHARRSFRLQYQTPHGDNQVKIDLDYLNRSPLLPVTTRTILTDTGTEVTSRLNSDIELFAAKTKALLERIAARDLYDVSSIAARYPDMFAASDKLLLRRVMLYSTHRIAPPGTPGEVLGHIPVEAFGQIAHV